LHTDQEIMWIDSEEDVGEIEDISFTEYDISASPNDFNIKTLFDFIESRIVKIPGFQRNYVWDIQRASKLIESIIIGIPIPQIFLYEEAKNKFLVIDGQQRYMTIYYYMKQRFPKKEKRVALRVIFDEHGKIPDEILKDNEYFSDFNLELPTTHPNQINKFNGLNYLTLDDNDKLSFDLRTIRNIIIKQNSPNDDHSVIFEIFNRLNSGGVNLKDQEIRASLFHSEFYDMLYRINLNKTWRKFTSTPQPDINMKDIEVLLRGFAMLIEGESYNPKMTKFLNKFSLKAKSFKSNNVKYLEELFIAFISKVSQLDSNDKLFHNKTGKFSISIYESVFIAACGHAFSKNSLDVKDISLEKVRVLKEDKVFYETVQSNTTSKLNIEHRLLRAKDILK